MAQYKLLNDLYLADETAADGSKGVIRKRGSIIELDDAAAADYIKRGSVREYTEGEDETADERAPLEGDVEKSFTINGVKYQKLRQEGSIVVYAGNGVEIDNTAYENAWQLYVKTLEDERLAKKFASDESTDESSEETSSPQSVVEDGILYWIEGDKVAAADDATFDNLQNSIVGFGSNKAEARADYEAKLSN